MYACHVFIMAHMSFLKRVEYVMAYMSFLKRVEYVIVIYVCVGKKSNVHLRNSISK